MNQPAFSHYPRSVNNRRRGKKANSFYLYLWSTFLDSLVCAERDFRIGRQVSNITKNMYVARMNSRFAASATVHYEIGISFNGDSSGHTQIGRARKRSCEASLPHKSPEPTAVGACGSAVAVHVASGRWLSFYPRSVNNRRRGKKANSFYQQDGVVKDLISTYGANEMDSGLNTGSKADTQDVEQNKRPK